MEHPPPQAFGGGDHGLVVTRLVDTLRETITPTDGLSLGVPKRTQRTRSSGTSCSPAVCSMPPARRLVEVQVLSPSAVMPEHQKRGIGSALVRNGLEALLSRPSPLSSWRGGKSGAYSYSRFGFAPGCEQGFRKPSLRIPDGAFQAIKLQEYEPWMTGTLVYALVDAALRRSAG